MSYWAVGAAIASAAINYENNQQVARRQDSQLASSLREQQSLQHQQDAKTRQLIQKTADSTPAAARSNLLDQFRQQILASNGNAARPLGQVGAVSDAYTKAANDAASGISQYGDTNARLLSAIDAPNLQRQGEAANLSRYGSELNQVRRESAGLDYLSRMRLAGIRPNPWLTAVSNGLQAYSAARAGGAGSGSTGSSWNQGNTISAGGGFTYNLPDY